MPGTRPGMTEMGRANSNISHQFFGSNGGRYQFINFFVACSLSLRNLR
jgi:hypothetical protein